MKTALRFVAFGLFISVGCAVAQFLTDKGHPNSMREAEVRTVAARLVIGMREEDAIGLLATNGLRVNATVQDINCWFYKYCYLDDTPYVRSLSLEFRQKPSGSGLMMTTNQHGVRHVLWTNGILQAAILNNVQIAKTNAP
jgi:hypothetical protein